MNKSGQEILGRLEQNPTLAMLFNIHSPYGAPVVPRARRTLYTCERDSPRRFVACAGKCFKVKFREKRWRTDMRCDPSGNDANYECDPKGLFPCCSAHGWCGNSDGHCECNGCRDFRKMGSEIRGCLQGPKYRRRPNKCETDDSWTDICMCDTPRCNGGVRVGGTGVVWGWWWRRRESGFVERWTVGVLAVLSGLKVYSGWIRGF